MFERVTIRRRSEQSLGYPIDLSAIAEALIYYGEVRLIANHAALNALFRLTLPEVVIALLEEDFLKLAYEPGEPIVLTNNANTPREIHEPTFGSFPHLDLQEYLPQLLAEVTGKSGRGRRLAQRILRKTEIARHDDKFNQDAAADLLDPLYVQESVRTLLSHYTPEYAGPSNFVVRREGKKFTVETDFDFAVVNSVYHRRVSPKHSTLSPAYLLAHLVTVTADLTFASRYSAEMSIDDVNALLLQQRLAGILDPLRASGGAIDIFSEFVFGQAKAIGNAVRSGAQTLEDLLRLLPHAMPFKTWLQQPDVQPDVLQAYMGELSSTSWVDKLPTKVSRWFLFSSAGLALDAAGGGGIGTAAGLTLSAVDTFLLDKLLKGWKPNQFVEELQKFIQHAKKATGRAMFTAG